MEMSLAKKRSPIWKNGETGFEAGQPKLSDLIEHRAPFLFVDHITRYDPSGHRVEACYRVKSDPFWVEGHFPNGPVYPGVFLIEQMAQTALCLLRLQERDLPGAPRLVGLDEVEFLAPCYPDDVLHSSVCILEDSLINLCHGQIFRGRELICQGLFKVMG